METIKSPIVIYSNINANLGTIIFLKQTGTRAIITPAIGEGKPVNEFWSELTLKRASLYATHIGKIEAMNTPKSIGLPKMGSIMPER